MLLVDAACRCSSFGLFLVAADKSAAPQNRPVGDRSGQFPEAGRDPGNGADSFRSDSSPAVNLTWYKTPVIRFLHSMGRLGLVAGLTCGASLVAQNLVVNGDFSQPLIQPWTLTGFATNPRVAARDANGNGAMSRAFVAELVPGQSLAVQQSVLLPSAGLYESRADVLTADPLAGGAASVRLESIGTARARIERGRSVQLRAFGDAPSRSTIRVALEVDWPWDSTTREWILDDVDVRPLRRPWVGSFSEPGAAADAPALPRVVGRSYGLPLAGTPGANWFVFAGLALTPSPRVLPGFAGELRVDPSMLVSLGGGAFPLSSTAVARSALQLTVPAVPALVGADLFVFGVEVDPVTGGSIGWESNRPFGAPAQGEISVIEDFADEGQLDQARSGGSWGNNVGGFSQVGGDGRHGDFDFRDGVDAGGGVYVFDTDMQQLSAKPSARETVVTGGEFHFTNFVVPSGVIVRFEGSRPAIVRVSGLARISGDVDASGVPVPDDHDAHNSTVVNGVVTVNGAGQRGGRPGPGGGRGGDGAFAASGDGTLDPALNNFVGFPGEDVRVPAGHLGAARVPGTGGAGAPLRPAHGDTSQLMYVESQFGAASRHVHVAMSSGGGGGYGAAGDAGIIRAEGIVRISPPNAPPLPTPIVGGSGGVQFDLFRFAWTDSLEHFSVGGSGGGGGGSHALFTNSLYVATNSRPAWNSGGAGSGGGGVLAVRSGREIRVAGAVRSRGGEVERVLGEFVVIGPGVPIRGIPGLGGGGSGGSILLQADRVRLAPASTLDVSGGDGALFFTTGSLAYADVEGGRGGDGVFRVETPSSAGFTGFGNTVPAAGQASAGLLRDTDSVVHFQSRFYRTDSEFDTYVRYELDVDVAGVPFRFDDTALANAAIDGAPVRIWFQGADLDPVTRQPIPGTITPWVRFVGDLGSRTTPGEQGLVDFGRNSFRFQLVADRTVSGNLGVEARRLEVVQR